MIKSSRLFISKAVVAAVFGIMAFMGYGEIKAQPTNYCLPAPHSNATRYYCYNYYSYITEVRITNKATGEVVLERNSGQDNCYIFVNNMEARMQPGTDYNLYVRRWNQSYYNYTRVYIDWNIDGDFFDSGLYSTNLRERHWARRAYGYNTWFSDNINISIPPDIEMGKTRMRIISNYYYDNGPCIVGYGYTWYSYQYAYGEGEDYILKFEGGVKETFPAQDDILFADESYDGTTRLINGVNVDFTNPTAYFFGNQPSGITLSYKISGPLPSTAVVYEALDPNNGSTNIDVSGQGDTYPIQAARGVAADGTDGAFKAVNGGTYRVVASMNAFPGELIQTFTVSWDDDLAISGIVSPRTNVAPKFFKYLRGQTIKVTGLFQNVGINNVTEFDAFAYIWNSDGDMVYQDSIHWDAGSLSTGDRVELDFRNVRFNDVGQYTLQICNDLLSATDQEEYNDCLARPGDNAYSFEVAHEIQVQADDIILPAQDDILLGNRPIVPQGQFKNVGIGDASDVPARMIIKNSSDEVVYESSIIIQDIQAGKYNTRVSSFDQLTISEPGDYEACIIITAEEDNVREDDTLCVTFTVEGGLAGVYTIGQAYLGNSNNYQTIEDAMDALYYRGVRAPVVFEFTDSEYDVRSTDITMPAWDITSRIIGLGWDDVNEQYNTLTFRAHRMRSSTRGGVTINLYAANGQGLKFGQSLIPSSEEAIVNKFPTTENANSAGHIKFDGGTQKALKFVLHSASDVHGAAIYLGRGTQNVTVMNTIIENGTSAIAENTYLPLVVYDPTNGYRFEADSTTGASKMSYSSGVVLRSTLLRFEESNFLNLDTIPNQNNVIQGNDISGFGYGVVSLGLGTLFLQNEAVYQRFYNKNNTISDNIIHDIHRAGIFLGYEEKSTVSGNRIYDIGDGTGAASGIIAGGASHDGIPGYNNISVMVDGNEISGINSSNMSTGITVEQVRNSFQNPAGGEIHFPNVAEDMHIVNNVVWGLSTTDADGALAGIHLMTERDYMQSNMMDVLTTPSNMEYLTHNDKIANNTILISDDGGTNNTGVIAGIGLQHAHNASVMNNAIAILDNSIDANNPINAAIFYQGRKPMDGGINGDRNAFWFGNSGASAYRFIETDEDNEIVELGDRNEFESLNQWQLWTGGEPNSVVGNFVVDHVFTGSDPQSLEVNMTPEAPLGSILDNRGDRLDFISNDIDGNMRGAAGQRYDIGAFEFLGRMFVSDVEMINLPTPGAYKSGTGMFSDAEYIMTTAPVEVRARVRNNGSLQQSGVDFRVQIFRQLPNGLYDDEAYIDETVQADIATTESADIYFNLADGLGVDFMPQTYADLAPEYNVPVQFSTMQANVTPKYMIKISIESDQNNANNIISKEVRFYLRKSPLKLLVSSENSFADLYFSGTPTADQVAGRLNADSLFAGLKDLGWYTDINEGRFDIDNFDRKGWEPKSVNYTMYRSLFWTDGADKALTRYEKMDINDFLNVGNDEVKKNLVIGSQEIVRSNSMGSDYDPDFLHTVLRSEYQAPGNPLGSNVSNDGNSVMGITVGRDLTEDIASTGYANDMDPYCGVMSIVEEGEGLSQVAYAYVNHDASPDNSTMGVATTSLTKNIVNLGVDWRHWSNMERLLRSILDYMDRNGGDVVPIELSEFNADAVGQRVDLSWATASELNSAMFEVEKAEMNEAGRSAFVKIDEVEAAGKSAVRREYGPVSDFDVTYGGTYVYRLRLIDNDGNYKYSDEKVVTLEGINGGISLSQAMPNPANSKTKFNVTLGSEMNVEMKLYDMNGQMVQTVKNGQLGSGSHEIEIDVRELSSGSYTLVLRSGDVVINEQVRVVK